MDIIFIDTIIFCHNTVGLTAYTITQINWLFHHFNSSIFFILLLFQTAPEEKSSFVFFLCCFFPAYLHFTPLSIIVFFIFRFFFCIITWLNINICFGTLKKILTILDNISFCFVFSSKYLVIQFHIFSFLWFFFVTGFRTIFLSLIATGQIDR